MTGLADRTRAELLARHQPVVEFGTPSFWPYIPGIPPYHNAGIWPFVSSYWTWASADAANTEGVEHGLGSIYRAAALFLTNKENMVAQTGHFEGTQINSDRQLWSVAGNLATVYRVLFGMRFTPEGLRFQPFVPEGYSGTRALEGVSYRDATLDIEMRGHGHRIVQITLDGKALDDPILPADLSGAHDVRIVLSGALPDSRTNLAPNRYSPPTPQVQTRADGAGALVWEAVPDVQSYHVYRNGTPHDTTASTRYELPPAPNALAEYQVLAVGVSGLSSFLSEPVRHVAPAAVDTVQVSETNGTLETQHEGYTGEGYLPLRTDAHGAELPERERSAAQAGSALEKEDRSRGSQLDRCGGREEQRRENGDPGQCAEDIDAPFPYRQRPGEVFPQSLCAGDRVVENAVVPGAPVSIAVAGGWRSVPIPAAVVAVSIAVMHLELILVRFVVPERIGIDVHLAVRLRHLSGQQRSDIVSHFPSARCGCVGKKCTYHIRRDVADHVGLPEPHAQGG